MRLDHATYAHLREIAWSDERRSLDWFKQRILVGNWQAPKVITRKLYRVTEHLQPVVTSPTIAVDEEGYRTRTMPTERIERSR